MHLSGEEDMGAGPLLMTQKLEHLEQRIAFEELLGGMRQEDERVERLEKAIREAVPAWSLVEVVVALQAMRGIDLIAAVTVLTEIGDLSRFQNPRELMGYLGLVPSESSTGDKVKRGTKAGNGRARRILVEAAWHYRYPPRVSRDKQPKVAAAPRRVREIAWKAQTRLCGRFRSLERKGKTAIEMKRAPPMPTFDGAARDRGSGGGRRNESRVALSLPLTWLKKRKSGDGVWGCDRLFTRYINEAAAYRWL
jgi:Transposase IS116/IS110/IS902 family